MHSTFFYVLGAALNLGALEASASVICDPKHVAGINSTNVLDPSAGALAEVTNHCIEDICATRGDADSFSKYCGPVSLTITHLGAHLSDVGDCVKEFRNIVDQCITTEGILDGISQTNEALYDVSAVDQYEDREKIRGSTRPKTIPRAAPRIDPKKKVPTTNPGTNGPKPNPKTNVPNAKPKTNDPDPKTNVPNPKTNDPKTDPNTKPKTNPKTDPNTKPQNNTEACPLTGQNGRAKVPRGCDSSHPVDLTQVYKQTALAESVDWYNFRKVRNWDLSDDRALPVLNVMREEGQLDVIKLGRGAWEVIGEQGRGTQPESRAAREGNYILCSGGFFNVGGERDRWPIGQTSYSGTSFVAPDNLYARDYVEIRDNENYLQSGPSLLEVLDLRDQRFAYWTSSARDRKHRHVEFPGSLAHASQNNERLVLGVSQDGHKYLFAYTSQRGRDGGLDLNQMRTLIETFMRSYFEVGVRDFQQLTNLDGGSSIYVSWNHGSRRTMITEGDIRDLAPTNPPTNVREIANVLKFIVS